MLLSHWTDDGKQQCSWDEFDAKADAMDLVCCPDGDGGTC